MIARVKMRWVYKAVKWTYKVLATVLCILVVSFTSSYSQVNFNSVESIWQYADLHNITIKTAQYETQKAELNKKASYGALLPQASITGSFTDNTTIPTNIIDGSIFGQPGTYRILKLGQQYVYTGTFNAQLDILNLQNIFSALIAKRTEEMNKASLANTKKTIYQQIAAQYYSFLLMKEAARLAMESEQAADSVYQSVNNKFKEGVVSEANVDIAKLNLSREQQTSITATYQMQTAKNNLKSLLGFSLSDSLDITATLEGSSVTDENKTFSEDPAIRLAFTQVRIAQSQYRVANSSFAPTISLLYSNGTTQYDSSYRPFSTSQVPWFPAVYWTLKANLPIFTGGSRLFQSQKNKIAYLESKEQYESSVKQSQINDENIKLSYKRTTEVLAKAQEVMRLSKDNYTHLSYRYSEGVASIEDKLKAFSDYIDYQNAYLNSLSDMLVQLYQLKLRQQSF